MAISLNPPDHGFSRTHTEYFVRIQCVVLCWFYSQARILFGVNGLLIFEIVVITVQSIVKCLEVLLIHFIKCKCQTLPCLCESIRCGHLWKNWESSVIKGLNCIFWSQLTDFILLNFWCHSLTKFEVRVIPFYLLICSRNWSYCAFFSAFTKDQWLIFVSFFGIRISSERDSVNFLATIVSWNSGPSLLLIFSDCSSVLLINCIKSCDIVNVVRSRCLWSSA